MTPSSQDHAHEPGVIHLALAADAQIADYIPTLMNSIVQHTPGELRVVVLGRGLSPAMVRRIETTAPSRVQWRFINMERQHFGQVQLLDHTTISTMDRLLLPELLPEVRRMIYLDIDTLVLGDLQEMWRLPVPECGLSARRSIDAGYETLGEVVRRWSGHDAQGLLAKIAQRGRGPLASCFNAGVLLMDLDHLRRQHFTDFCLKVVANHQVNDQVALNVYAAGRQGELDQSWNVFVGREQVPDPRILHFVGPRKPWNRRPQYTRLWMKYYVPGLTPLKQRGLGTLLAQLYQRLAARAMANRS